MNGQPLVEERRQRVPFHVIIPLQAIFWVCNASNILTASLLCLFWVEKQIIITTKLFTTSQALGDMGGGLL